MATLQINQQAPVSIPSGKSLFEACEEIGLIIPSACGGRGLCGFCRTRVLSGAPDTFTDAENKKLTAEEKAAGVRLLCQIPVQEASAFHIALSADQLSAHRYTGHITQKHLLTHDIISLHIHIDEAPSAVPPLHFRAGQYLQLERPPTPPIRTPTLRAYSFASNPAHPEHIQLIIRRMPEGNCSVWIHNTLNAGDPIALRAPFGNFHLSDDPTAPMICIAGGSGLSPFLSIFEDMKTRAITTRPALLFFGARTQADLYLLDYWAEFAAHNPWFTFVPVLSNEPEDSDWNGARGLVTDEVTRRCPSLECAEAYLCGSPGMIDSAISVLTTKGLPYEKIFYDKFTQ